MLGQIVEISGEGRRLSLKRGFLRVSGPEGLIGEVPLGDIEAVIAATPAITYSNQLLAALAERGAPVVICSTKFTPAAVLMPIDGHHAQGERFEAQAGAALPLKKRAWAQLVKAKIQAQAAVLELVGKDPKALRVLGGRVRSGDRDNVEATAAQRYWPALFGPEFRRDRDREGINAYLNYGYTVLRAAAARAIVGAGLHPSLGLHHKSRGDALRLADDLMEPFRPAVDLMAHEISNDREQALTPEIKRRLAGVLYGDYLAERGVTTLSGALSQLARSLARVYLGTAKKLVLPQSPVPLSEDDAAAMAGLADDDDE